MNMHRCASWIALAATLATLLAAGCNQAQEDRAAEQTAKAIREGNQALRELASSAKQGAEKAAEMAREAGREAGPVISDAALTAKVKAALLADSRVAGSSIDVDTQGGVVTLTGNLPDNQAKTALEIARGIEGVKSVENRLTAGTG
jgi:hyperosmotically inducible periplasmic protein